MIDRKNLFDQPVRNDLATYNCIQKIATSQGDDYKNGFFLNYIYFKNYYKIVCSYHVTYVFQSESTLYSCLNIKELLA